MSTGEITMLLFKMRDGDKQAMNDLFEKVYGELRAMARRQARRGGPNPTLDTTALVNEAYLKLVDQEQAAWNDRKHFLSVAALAMRHILVNHAREKQAQKRGGDIKKTDFRDSKVGTADRTTEILAVDEALDQLAKLNERLSRVVELRYFGSLSVEETAEVLEVDPRTVKRDWRKARAFLYRLLSGDEEDDSPST